MFGWLTRPIRFGRRRWPLDQELFRWNKRDGFTIGQSYCGLLVLGGTGSGKSSTTAKMTALGMLRAGYGGLVLSVKSELETWRQYCRQTRRSRDLRVVDASGQSRFNFLDELLAYQSGDVTLVENIVSLFMEVGAVGSRGGGGKGSDGQGDSQFFELATKELLRNLITLLILATGKVSVSDLCRLVAELPRTPAQLASEEWQRSSLVFKLLMAVEGRATSATERHEFEPVTRYVCSSFPNLAQKTQSSITATFSGMADLFQRGLLHTLHGQDSTLSPRAIDDGAIIVHDLNLKRFGDIGLYSQLVWKTMTQRWLERRPIGPRTRPAFIFVDEFQFLASQHTDALFATTCRASKVANVLITQSVAGIETAFGGGPMGRALSDQLCANLSTKVVHATSDPGTAEWASNLIGKNYRLLANSSCPAGGTDWSAMGGLGGGDADQGSAGVSESLQYDVEPRQFAYLRTGGPENAGVVDGVVIRSGLPFRTTGTTWMPVTFKQK